MLQTLLVVLVCTSARPDSVVPDPVAIAAASPVAVEEGQEVADGRPEVEAHIAKLVELAGKQDEQALEAVAVIGALRQEFARSGPKDKRDVAQAIARLFVTRKASREKDAPSDPIHLAAAEALADMAPQSVTLLVDALENKGLRRDLVLQRQLLLALGGTRDKRAIDPLLDRLHDKDAVLVGAAGEALGSFESADQATRKRIFEEILKISVSAKGAVDRVEHEQGSGGEPQPNAQGAVLADRYETIRVPLLTSLARLAKHREEDPDAWQRWWNKNKKADWDAAKEDAKG